MYDRKKISLIAVILPVTIISNQGGVSIQNNVTTSGTSQVTAESQVQQQSNQSISIQNSNGTSVQNNSKTHTKMEITVNGKTKKLETDEPGNYRLEMTDNSTGSANIIVQNGDKSPFPTIGMNTKAVVQFTGKHISVGEYLQELFKSLFSKIISGF